ncbi:MAG: hypothetical protein AABZ94_01825 [Candidatus Eisenbacteria bacterium]
MRSRGNLDTRCPLASTRRIERRIGSRGSFSISVAFAIYAILVSLSLPASAAPSFPEPLDARVVWHRADHVYVVLGDSGSVAPGDTLLIRSGKKQVAAAPIVSIAEGGLAVARLVSGTLARERKLDRLRVLAARRPLPSPSTIRVGFPSGRRAANRTGCDRWTLRPPLGMAYRVEPMGRLGYRLTRDSTDSLSGVSASGGGALGRTASWPDTIVASLFDDAAEEEIALERGDLDVALFEPGELSARTRAAPRWQIHLAADCPVLTPPEFGPYVRALGAPAFLAMVDCGAGGGGP